MIEQGKVVALNPGSADVAMQKAAECEDCKLCVGFGGQRILTVDIPEKVQLNVGQDVTVEISSGETLKGGFMIFILPLILFLVGAVAGKSVFTAVGITLSSDAASIIAGCVLFTLSMGVAALVYRSDKKKRKLKPQLKLNNQGSVH